MNGSIAEFISSYGEQLNIALIRKITVTELNMVEEKCLNIQFHVDIPKDELLLLPTLRILGKRLKTINLTCFNIGAIKIDATAWAAASRTLIWKCC